MQLKQNNKSGGTRARIALISLVLLLSFTSLVNAAPTAVDEVGEINRAMRSIAAALAILIISIQGLKWVTSDTPAERAEAKKGMTYIILGVVVVYLAAHIVCGLYGLTLRTYSIYCTLDPVNVRCTCT
jgi:NADH:ubiquinone oxidoreductase subunit 2 (subunit N)